jgi:hypothetical protein
VTGDLALIRSAIWGYSTSPQTYRTDTLDALARVEARLTKLGEICDRLIDAGIDHWRADDGTRLHDWLGLSWDEYKAWVQGNAPFDYDKKTST